jgi:hypothetical protein
MQQRNEAKKETENVVFLFMIIRNGLPKLSRYTWPIKSPKDSLGTSAYGSDVHGLAKPYGKNSKCWEQTIPIPL